MIGLCLFGIPFHVLFQIYHYLKYGKLRTLTRLDIFEDAVIYERVNTGWVGIDTIANRLIGYFNYMPLWAYSILLALIFGLACGVIILIASPFLPDEGEESNDQPQIEETPKELNVEETPESRYRFPGENDE